MIAKVIKTGEIVEVYHEPQHGQITNIYKEAVFVNGRMWSEEELDFNCITKANTPNKIYINPNLENRTWLIGKGDVSFIEYTRTDAFIDKACEAFCKVCKMPNCNSKDCSYLKDFRNYMKGG